MTIPPTIERWRCVALERRAEELAGIHGEDCVFESPVVHTPRKGRAICGACLRGALSVLNTEHLRYGGVWGRRPGLHYIYIKSHPHPLGPG